MSERGEVVDGPRLIEVAFQIGMLLHARRWWIRAVQAASDKETDTMNLVDIRRFEMLTRVRDFGVEHASVFPTTSVAGKIFTDVSDAVDKLDRQAVSQFTGQGSSLEGTQSKASARQALRDTLEHFTLTAQAIALANETDGLENQFRMPRTGDQRLLTAAKAFLDEAAPLKADFIAHGMPETFLDDLSHQIEDFEHAVAFHTVARETRAASHYGMNAAMEQGLHAAVRLDAVVKNSLRDDGEALAKWSIARHVDYPGRSRHPRPPVATQPPPPAAAPAPIATTQPALGSAT